MNDFANGPPFTLPEPDISVPPERADHKRMYRDVAVMLLAQDRYQGVGLRDRLDRIANLATTIQGTIERLYDTWQHEHPRTPRG